MRWHNFIQEYGDPKQIQNMVQNVIVYAVTNFHFFYFQNIFAFFVDI